MSLADLKAALSQASNLSQLKGLSAAYSTLLGGIPSLDGYDFLIKNNNATNFGAGAGPVFNDENIIINTLNALYQGNPTAKAAFDLIIGGGLGGTDVLAAVYNYVVPASFRSEAGLAYFKSQEAFYTARAAELGIPGAAGAAVVAFAAITKIAVDNKIGGLGDSLNDLIDAINNGTAAIPQNATTFTDLETADGTQFDTDDTPTSTTPPVYSIAMNPSSVIEGDTGPGRTITFTVSRTGDISKAGTVGLTVVGTANIGGDYDLSPADPTVSFAPGASSATFTVTTKPDTQFEPDETITFLLTNPTGGGTLSILRSVTATITNDDVAPTSATYTIVASPSSVVEGNSGPGNTLTYTVLRAGDVSKAGTVAVALSGTADGSDYTTSLSGGGISFAPGQNQLSFTVTTTPDTTVEANETVIATLGTITGGGTIGTLGSATGTITNDDTVTTGPVYSIAASPSSVTEGNTGPGAAITYTVTRTGDISKAGAVGLTYLGTATNGVDYDLSTATSIVSFAAGASTATLTATVRPDTQVEPNETITVLIDSVGGGGAIGTANSATATITNDDTTQTGPTYTIGVSLSVPEGNSAPGNIITFTVFRTGDVSQPGSVAVTLSGAADSTDYTTDLVGGIVSFGAGHDQVSFTVTTLPDVTVEPNESVIATLGAITGGGTLGATTVASPTINNDDTAPQGLIQATNTQVITGTTGNDQLTVTALAPTVVSDLKEGANTITLADGVDISAATYLGGINQIKLVDGGSATMNVSQANIIEAPGVNTVTIKDSGTIFAYNQVENYKIGAGNDIFTMSIPTSGDRYVDIGAGGSDLIRFYNERFSSEHSGVLIVNGFDTANDKIASRNFSARFGEEEHGFGGTISLPNQSTNTAIASGTERTVWEIETTSAGTLSGATIRQTGDGGAVATLIANALGGGLTSFGGSETISTAIIYVTGVGAAIYQFNVAKQVPADDLVPGMIVGVELIGVLAGVADNSISAANF